MSTVTEKLGVKERNCFVSIQVDFDDFDLPTMFWVLVGDSVFLNIQKGTYFLACSITNVPIQGTTQLNCLFLLRNFGSSFVSTLNIISQRIVILTVVPYLKWRVNYHCAVLLYETFTQSVLQNDADIFVKMCWFLKVIAKQDTKPRHINNSRVPDACCTHLIMRLLSVWPL